VLNELIKLAPAPGVIYRSDYLGEYITLTVIQEDKKRSEVKEWCENRIQNDSHNKIACVLGNGPSRAAIDVKILTRHKGGHLGKKKMQVYGCNALYRDAVVDFLVCTNPVLCEELVRTYNYAPKNVVLTTTENIVRWRGRFHLYPFYEKINAGALTLKLACFDGHKKVYILGFDNLPEENACNNVYNNTLGYSDSNAAIDTNKWINNTFKVMQTYTDVDFCMVIPKNTLVDIPKIYNQLRNFRVLDWRSFVIEADL
jgi:hypothetical protein